MIRTEEQSMHVPRIGPRMAAAAAVLLLAAPGLAGDVEVGVGHSRLEPAEITIGVGDTVTWTNRDAMPGGHSVAAEDGSFESPALGVGESFRHTFTTPGTVRYAIQEHPETQGTIVVE
jgi:plastocyanin